MKQLRMALLVTSGLAPLIAGSPLLAQVAPSEQAAQVANAQTNSPIQGATAAAPSSEDIVVTAQKREEKILKIPQSVTVVSGATLEREHATTFSQYLNEIPSLSLEQNTPGVGRLSLRGVNTGGVSSTVSVYIDETPFGSSSGLVNGAILAGDFDTFDVARIEVLRGPQGTLYGASSLGGVLKFVTNAPKLGDLSGRARAGIDFVDGGGVGYNMNGVLNVPLGANAAFRGSGFYRKNAGWIDGNGADANFLGVPALGGKNINQSKVWGGRGSLLFKPSDALSIRLTAIAQEIKSDASSFVEVNQNNYKPINGKFRQTRYFRDPTKLKYQVYDATVAYDFGFANLLSSTSLGKNDETFRADLTLPFGNLVNFLFGPLNPNVPGFPFPQLTTDPIGLYQNQQTNLHKFTQEVRLASPTNHRFEWMVGGYYTKEKGTIDQSIPGIDFATGQTFTNPTLHSLATALVKSRYREIAAFTNDTLHVTDHFDITAGARISKIKQKSSQITAGFLANGGSPLTSGGSKESVFTYSLSPRYEINDHTAVYLRVAKGYRPGGPNIVPTGVSDNVPRSYKADTIVSYEAGLKAELGHRLSLDLAAYHLNWKNIQLFEFANNFGFNANGGKAVSNGVEGTLTLRPMRGLRLSANGSLINAHLTADTGPFVGGFKGDKLPYVPKASLSLNGDYEWPLSGSATAYVGGGVRYVGKQRDNFIAGKVVGVDPAGGFIFAFTPQRRIPAYTTVDLRAGVQFGRFSIDAFARNVNNSRGVNSLLLITDSLTGGNPLPNNAINAALLQPRTIGMTLGAAF